jgi:hypothetical protein
MVPYHAQGSRPSVGQIEILIGEVATVNRVWGREGGREGGRRRNENKTKQKEKGKKKEKKKTEQNAERMRKVKKQHSI